MDQYNSFFNDNKEAIANYKRRKKLADSLRDFVAGIKSKGQTHFSNEDIEAVRFDDLTENDKDMLRYVVDLDSYVKWVEAAADPHLDEEWTEQHTSVGKRVSLKTLIHRFKPMIEHLPEDEQRELLQKREVWHKASAKAGLYKRMAFTGFSRDSGKVAKAVTSRALEDRKKEVLELFGKMLTDSEVLEVVVKKWGLALININDIRAFKSLHGAEIKRKIEDYKASYTDVRLAVKRSRIDEMCWIYNTCKKRYDRDDSREDLKLMLQTLKSLREEVEGNKLLLEGSLDVNVEAKVKIHIQKQIINQSSIRNLVIGRVASRMGIPPEFMIKRLNDSYFQKYTKVLQEEGIEDAEFEVLDFPSDKQYNFEEIEELNKKFNKEREEIIDKDVLSTYKGMKVVKETGLRDLIVNKFAEEKRLVEEVKDETSRLGFEAHASRMRTQPYGKGKEKDDARTRLEKAGEEMAKQARDNRKSQDLLKQRKDMSVEERMALVRELSGKKKSKVKKTKKGKDGNSAMDAINDLLDE